MSQSKHYTDIHKTIDMDDKPDSLETLLHTSTTRDKSKIKIIETFTMTQFAGDNDETFLGLPFTWLKQWLRKLFSPCFFITSFSMYRLYACMFRKLLSFSLCSFEIIPLESTSSIISTGIQSSKS